MKQILFILLLLVSTQVKSQNKKDEICYSIQFKNTSFLDSTVIITPEYNPKGFYLVNNGVYDFVIDGKKYFQSILLKVEKDSFYISRNWESGMESEKISDTLKFSISQKIQIRMLSIKDGVGGLPFRTKIEDYVVSAVPADKYCKLKYVKIDSKGSLHLGHFYFTAYGLKEIKIVKGKPYFVEPRGEYVLRRN
jgi:hypothetical protein|nr:hypothetical protein [uncultured Pedobacter sp.]